MAADLDGAERSGNGILSLRDYYYLNGWRDQWRARHSLVTASRHAQRPLFATVSHSAGLAGGWYHVINCVQDCRWLIKEMHVR